MFVVPATSIEFTPLGTDLIPDQTVLNISCITDESNPMAEVLWSVNGYSLTTDINANPIPGNYEAFRTQSVLTITADRSLNGAEYTCVLGGRGSINDNSILTVGCMYDLLPLFSFPFYC